MPVKVVIDVDDEGSRTVVTEEGYTFDESVEDTLAVAVEKVARAHGVPLRVVTEFYPEIANMLRDSADTSTDHKEARQLREAAAILESPK